MMSLLNDMLNDLNAKKFQKQDYLLASPAEKHWFKRLPYYFVWFAFIIVLMTLASVFVFWPWPTKTVTSTSIPKTVLTSTLVPVVMPLEPLLTKDSLASEEINREENEDTFVDDASDAINTGSRVHFSEQDRYDEKMNQALQAIEEGNDDYAFDLLTSIMDKFPSSVEARENLIALYLSHQEFKSANNIVDEGLERQPYNLRFVIMKSRILVEQGKPTQALALLEKFNPDMNKAPDYYALLAAILESLGHTNAAGSVYEALIKIDPSNGQYWLGLGVALEHKNSNQQAMEAYRQASQSDNIQASVRLYAENRLKSLQG